MDATGLAEDALERLRLIMVRWPRPATGQGVRADALRAGLAPLLPLAEAVLALPLKYGKGFYPGAGFLSGSPLITSADHKVARAVEQDLNVILPYAGTKPIDRQLYAKIKMHAYQLLGLATDLDVTQGELAKVGPAAGAAWDRWASLNAGGVVVQVGGARPGWIAPRFRGRDGAAWRWTGAHGTDSIGRHVQTLRSTKGETMDLAQVDIEAFVREGELTPLADEGSVAAALGQVAPGQRPVDNAAERRMTAILARVTKFVNSFPRPTNTQMVKAPETLAALAPLRPLALRVSQLTVGDKKGQIAPPNWIDRVLSLTVPYQLARAYEGGAPDPATGYLTGSATVTQEDINVGRWLLGAIDEVLPRYPVPTLAPAFYDEIKRKAHQLLLVCTDLDVDTTAADQTALLWQSFREAVKEFAAAALEHGKEGMGVLTKVLIALGLGAGAVAVASVVRK